MDTKKVITRYKSSFKAFNGLVLLTLFLETKLVLLPGVGDSTILLYFISLIMGIALVCRKQSIGIACYWVYLYLLCSFIVVGCFYGTGIMSSYKNSQLSDFLSISEAGIAVFVVVFSFLLFFYNLPKTVCITERTLFVPKIKFFPTFILAVILSLVSLFLGIGKMGYDNYALPFHLSGIIQFYRAELYPLIFLCVYASVPPAQNNKKKYYVLFFFVWALAECFVRFSKSALISSFLPIALYEIIKNKDLTMSGIKKFTPILLAFLALYPIIGLMRENDSKDIKATSNLIDMNNAGESMFIEPFNRVFYTGELFIQDNGLIANNNLFDFSNAIPIFAVGGSARYQTIVIEGYSDEANHSSGSTPFIDSLLIGGKGLMYITIFIFLYFAYLIDKRRYRGGNNIITAALCVGYYRLFDMLSISLIVSSFHLRLFIVYIVFIAYVKYKLNKEIKI